MKSEEFPSVTSKAPLLAVMTAVSQVKGGLGGRVGVKLVDIKKRVAISCDSLGNSASTYSPTSLAVPSA